MFRTCVRCSFTAQSDLRLTYSNISGKTLLKQKMKAKYIELPLSFHYYAYLPHNGKLLLIYKQGNIFKTNHKYIPIPIFMC